MLIISPHYPPVNSADMHRVRHMLHYLEEFGWSAEIVTVKQEFIESYSTDDILLKSIPRNQIVHYVEAFKLQYTRKIGLGSLSLRSFFQYKKKVDELLKRCKVDLIFFSTTAFHVMALGPYWKKKFGVPFVLDIQDPWRSDFYLDKPKNERPPKFQIAYLIDKFLEKRTVPLADGIISVSESYIETLEKRYPGLKAYSETIPFAGFEKDFELLDYATIPENLVFSKENVNIVYIGRGGYDMKMSVTIYFQALNIIRIRNVEVFNRIKTYFLGTSYVPNGDGEKIFKSIALELGLGMNVVEITNRLEYYTTLKLLKAADVLFVPGSIDSSYTASKIFPYILAKKPLVACFNEKSSVVEILKNCTTSEICSFNSNLGNNDTVEIMYNCVMKSIDKIGVEQNYNKIEFDKYSAHSMTRKIISFFNRCIS